jgi:transposase
VCQQLDRLEFCEQQRVVLEQSIRQLYRQLDPERTLERQVPGIGETIAAAIEAFIGDVERFDNLKSFAAYFGVVPRSRRTGDKDKSRQRITKGGSSVLKQYIFLAAEVARRNDPELASTYQQASARGKHHVDAVIVVAHKLVRRIYALLKLRAQTRQARAEGQTAQQPPAVAYRLTNPESGTPLSRSQARAYVDAHFPPKSASAKKPSKAT